MHFSRYISGWSTLLLYYVSKKSIANADPGSCDANTATTSINPLPNGATVFTGEVGTQTVEETFIPTLYSQYASLTSFLTLAASVPGSSAPPVVIGTGGVAWAPWSQSLPYIAAPSELPSVAKWASGSTGSSTTLGTVASSSASDTPIITSSPSSAATSAPANNVQASTSSETANAAPLPLVTTSYDPAALTVGSVEASVTANTAIKTSDDHHPIGLYPFIKGGPSCFFCTPGLDNGGFFLFGMDHPGIFPPPPTPPFPGIKGFPTITIGNDLSPTPDTEDEDLSASTAASSPTSISPSSISSISSCSKTLTASDCSVACYAASGTGSASSCSTSCYSTITGCSATGLTTTSTASGSACSGPQPWSDVVDGTDYRGHSRSISATNTGLSTTTSLPPPPPSISPSTPSPPSSTPPPPPPASSAPPPPPPASSTPPPPPPPPPPQVINCDKFVAGNAGIGASGPAGGLGNSICSCKPYGAYSSNLVPNGGCCDDDCHCKASCASHGVNKLRRRGNLIDDARPRLISSKQARRRIIEHAVSIKALDLGQTQQDVRARAPSDTDQQWLNYAAKGQQYYNEWTKKDAQADDKALPCNFDDEFTIVPVTLTAPADSKFLKGLGLEIEAGKTYYSINAQGPQDSLFLNTMSPKEGVFLAKDNNRGTDPIPYYFSDVAWWQWKKSVAKDNPSTLDYSGMKFFFRSQISNADTLSVMAKAFKSDNNADGSRASTFSPGNGPSDDAKTQNPFWALLGTLNGNGIIHSLTNYKKSMHGKGIDKLTTGTSEGEYYMWATFSS